MQLDYGNNGNSYPNPIDSVEWEGAACMNCGEISNDFDIPHYCTLECECDAEAKQTFKNIDWDELDDVVISGIDRSDYPDFCDAYIESAEYNGHPLSEKELETATEVFVEEIQQYASESLF